MSLIGWCLFFGLKTTSGCFGFRGFFLEGLLCKSKSASACDLLGLPRRSYKTIHGCLLSLLDLLAHERSCAINRDWAVPVGPEAAQR